jgi:hypothetical protein
MGGEIIAKHLAQRIAQSAHVIRIGGIGFAVYDNRRRRLAREPAALTAAIPCRLGRTPLAVPSAEIAAVSSLILASATSGRFRESLGHQFAQRRQIVLLGNLDVIERNNLGGVHQGIFQAIAAEGVLQQILLLLRGRLCNGELLAAVAEHRLRSRGFESGNHAQLDLLPRVVVEFLRLIHGALPDGQIVVIGDQVPIQVQNV